MNCECNGTDLPALSKDIAAFLSREFTQHYTARHNGLIVYDLSELQELRVDVVPAGLSFESLTRGRTTDIVTINVVMQKQARTQEEIDRLTLLATTTLRALLKRRFLNNSIYCETGSFVSSNVFERLTQYSENVFQSMLEITLRSM